MVDGVIEWVSKNRGKAAIVAVSLLVLAFLALYFAPRTAAPPMAKKAYLPQEKAASVAEGYSEIAAQVEQKKLTFLEGSARAEVESAEAAERAVESKVKELGGFVESRSKTSDQFTETRMLVLRIPAERLQAFTEWLSATYRVKSLDVRLRRVDVTLTVTEEQILEKALKDYESLREKAEEEAELTPELVNTLSLLTDKQAELARRLASQKIAIAEQEDRARYATFTLTLVEKKPVKLLPQDIRREFMLRLSYSIREAVLAVEEIVTEVPLLFIKAIGFAFALLAVAAVGIPALLALAKMFGFFRRLLKV